jgi:hypothetical protein
MSRRAGHAGRCSRRGSLFPVFSQAAGDAAGLLCGPAAAALVKVIGPGEDVPDAIGTTASDALERRTRKGTKKGQVWDESRSCRFFSVLPSDDWASRNAIVRIIGMFSDPDILTPFFHMTPLFPLFHPFVPPRRRACPWARPVKPVGKPTGILHVRFDERGMETEHGGLLGHRQPNRPARAKPCLTHRATPRLYFRAATANSGTIP